MDKKGKFIVIEAADRDRASHYRGEIATHLIAQGCEVEEYDLPYTDQPSAYFICKYLDGSFGDQYDVSPYTVSLLYAFDRLDYAHRITAAVSKGKIVLVSGFTGSTMAQQGGRFDDPVKLRSYLVWLDYFEHDELHLPRPDMSFFVSAEQFLETMESICKLFPKSYRRVADKELLGTAVDHIVALPAEHSDAKGTEYVTEEVSLSYLATMELARTRLTDFIVPTDVHEASTPGHTDRAPGYYVPTALNTASAEAYEQGFERLMAGYEQIRHKLQVHNEETDDIANLVLPVATISRCTVRRRSPEFDDAIIRLRGNPLPELRDIAGQLLHMKNGDGDTRTAVVGPSGYDHDSISSTYMPASEESVRLTAVWPRNELDIVADILYGRQNLDDKSIGAALETWSYERKVNVLTSYLTRFSGGSLGIDHALENVRYTWEIVSSAAVYTAFTQRFDLSATAQPLTPRYGYEVPEVIVESGLTDTYEECFDTSLVLHSILQQAGYDTESQYATLLGHKLRWKLTISGSNLFRIRAESMMQPVRPALRDLIVAIQAALLEKHPLIAEALLSI